MKLVAFGFGPDGTDGDSVFYPGEDNAIQTNDKATFAQLLKTWKERNGDEGDEFDHRLASGF